MEIVKVGTRMFTEVLEEGKGEEAFPGYKLHRLDLDLDDPWPEFPNKESVRELLLRAAQEGLFRQGLELLNILKRYPVEELEISLLAGNVLNGNRDLLKSPHLKYISTALRFYASGPEEDPLKMIVVILKGVGFQPTSRYFIRFEIERV